MVGGARRELAEQQLDVGLADAAEDTVQDAGERPFGVEDMAAHQDFYYVLGCHADTSFPSPFVLGEDLQEEQEHVQDVQEDRRGQQRRGGDVRIGPRPLEVEQDEPGEDD